MRKIFALAILLTCAVGLAAPAAPEKVLLHPDYEAFARDKESGSKPAGPSALAPVYPYLAEYLVERFDLAEKAGIGIDLGGGPGNLVVELCKRTKSLYWIDADINPQVFKGFYQSLLANGSAHRASAVFADAQALPFRDNYADIVVSRGSFQFWADKRKAFSEIYRVLKPGGVAWIGRGFPENLPVKVAKEVRANQKGGMPAYNVKETERELRALMRELHIVRYEIVRPKAKRKDVSYGIWVTFRKDRNSAPSRSAPRARAAFTVE